MKLVRFGNVVVNMKRVNSIDLADDGTWARLYYSGPLTPNGIESLQPDFTELLGEDALALQAWLRSNSYDALTALQ